MATLGKRSIIRSVMRRIRELFQAPPDASGFTVPFGVYGEVEIREFGSGTFDPDQHRPCLFVTDSHVRPTKMPLPYIAVEASLGKAAFEIGNEKGWRATVMCHVFGRMPGERDDIASAIASFIGNQISIYDYRVSTSGSFVEYAMVYEGAQVEDVELPTSRNDLRVESTLDAWSTVSFELQTLN